jgi:hypothetical protein
MSKSVRFLFWKFVHNAVVHPLMGMPWEEPAWLLYAHEKTAQLCEDAL